MQMIENVLTFKVPATNSGEVYVDIARAMNIVNRGPLSKNRQQGLWHVHGACFFADAVQQGTADRIGVQYEVSVSGAPRNWVTRNALVKAFEHWKEQQRAAYNAVSPSIKPKWQDFKVWLNDNHRTTGDLIPVSGHMFGGSDPYLGGEWVRSKLVAEIVDADGHIDQIEPELHIIGDDNGDTNKGIIKAYANSRARVQDTDPALPADPSGNIYAQSSEAIDDRIEGIVENLEIDNDVAPYDPDEYPGGANNGEEPLLYAFGTNTTTTKRKISVNGFAAPNGLLEIQYNLNMTGVEAGSGEFWIQLFVSHREAY